jgi:hypothetical protein
VTDAEIERFVADTMKLDAPVFLLAVAKVVRARLTGWTLKAAAQFVRRVAQDHGYDQRVKARPEAVSP